jgi:hypothetical protein
MLSWVELDAMRAYACRLDSERALTSLEQAEAWVRERGVVEGTSHCSLPSLHVATHEPRTSWALPAGQSIASPRQVAFGAPRTVGLRPDLSIPRTRVRLD